MDKNRMNEVYIQHLPDKVRTKLGSKSRVCLLNGSDVFALLRQQSMIVMACNARIKHVIPGIMKAAEELDAVVAFELTRSEGGLDGGYTGQTPGIYVDTIIDYAEKYKFTKPFIIHGDHITVRDTSQEELANADHLLKTQIEAGFTSFALDASFNPLADNIRIVSHLAQQVIEQGYGLEVELGEVKPVGNESNLTTVEETVTFLSTLFEQGIKPDLLAIDNGSKSGNYLEGEMVRIDLDRTNEIYLTAMKFGLAGLVQHGITGTPLRIVGKLADYGIRKGNIGTLWQNVAHAGFPLDLMDSMRRWSRENRKDLKYATGVFKTDIDAIPTENARQIHDMAYREAKEFLTAFNSKGSASKLATLLTETSCAS
jgi:fructose-bisphosphate aldolase class II